MRQPMMQRSRFVSYGFHIICPSIWHSIWISMWHLSWMSHETSFHFVISLEAAQLPAESRYHRVRLLRCWHQCGAPIYSEVRFPDDVRAVSRQPPDAISYL